MSNYDDFKASHIFYYDQNNNSIYTKDDGKEYIINNSKLKNELQDIEGYRSFIYPERKRRFISFLLTMFVSASLLFLYYLFFDEPTELIITLVVAVTYWSIHLYIPYMFHKKIENILDKCTPLSISKSSKDKDINKKIIFEKDNLQTTIKQKDEHKETYYNQVQQESKSFTENLRYITSDYNFLHLILFIIIAVPFLLVVYYIVKAWLVN